MGGDHIPRGVPIFPCKSVTHCASLQGPQSPTNMGSRVTKILDFTVGSVTWGDQIQVGVTNWAIPVYKDTPPMGRL